MDRLISSMNKIMQDSTSPAYPTVTPQSAFEPGIRSINVPATGDSTAFALKKGRKVVCWEPKCPAYIFEFEDGTIEQPEKFQTTMPRCSRCRQARYCSKQCQRADWKRHKPGCVPVKNDKPVTTKLPKPSPMANSMYGLGGSKPIQLSPPRPPPAPAATTPTGWSVGYLFRRIGKRGDDHYILVMFPWYTDAYTDLKDFYENRVYFIEYADNPVDCALYLEKSKEAERYRDGGSTYIALSGNRKLSMPFGKEPELVYWREEEEPTDWFGEEGEPEFETVQKIHQRESLIDLSELSKREVVLSNCPFLRRFMEENNYLIRKPQGAIGAGCE